MADLQDATHATHEAEVALRSLNTYLGQTEEGERDGSLGVMVAGVAVATALAELTTRIDYLTHKALEQTTRSAGRLV